MLRKLIVLAITSGLAAKLYRKYVDKRSDGAAAPATPAPRRRRAGTQSDQA